MQKLYSLRDMLCEELKQYGEKEKLDVTSLEAVDKLAHALKNLDKIIESYEEKEEYSHAMPYTRMYDEGSYARGRGRYAKRDSMGRYSRNDGGYSRADANFHREMQELIQDAPNDYVRQQLMDISGM